MNSLFADPVAGDVEGGLSISRRAGDSLEMGAKWEEAAQGHESPSERGTGGAKGQTDLRSRQPKRKENLIVFI